MTKTEKYKFEMKQYIAGLIVLLSSGAILMTSAFIQPGSFFATMKCFEAQPQLYLFNWLPGLFIIILLYCVIRNVFFSASVTALFINLLSYANLLKIEGRNDPLVPADIQLIKEAVSSARDFQLNLHLELLLCIVLFSIGLFVLGIFIKSPKTKWAIRLCCCIVTITAFLLMVKFVYTNVKIFNGLDVPNRYNNTSVFNNLGFNYCFLHNFNRNAVDKPVGYSKDEVENWISRDSDVVPVNSTIGAVKPETVKPHIIMVMCEAFTDLSDEDVFDYTVVEDPLKEYKKLIQSEQAISGHLVVTNFGAGTSNTEYDVLTGMQTNRLNSITYAFRTIHKNMLSLPRVYAAESYNTFFIHPGYEWFYSRNSVYRYLGIEDQTFQDAFVKSDYKGTIISEEAFLRKLELKFEQSNAAGDNPVFSYNVSIQNHQTYGYDKYGFEPEAAPVSVDLSDASTESLAVYMEGIRDSSKMLLALTEYFDAIDEPVVLVFFGDHRPILGDAYKELGVDINVNETVASTINTYKTPFVIWQNKAYADDVAFSDIKYSLDLSVNGLISDNYLGALVYELTGMTGKDAFFDYLNEMRRELPVFWKTNYCLPDGTYTDTLTQEQQELINKLDKWSYYKLKQETVK